MEELCETPSFIRIFDLEKSASEPLKFGECLPICFLWPSQNQILVSLDYSGDYPGSSPKQNYTKLSCPITSPSVLGQSTSMNPRASSILSSALAVSSSRMITVSNRLVVSPAMSTAFLTSLSMVWVRKYPFGD